MADYIAIHQIERRVPGKDAESIAPGSRLTLSGKEEQELAAAGAIRSDSAASAVDDADETPVQQPPQLTVADIKAKLSDATRDDLDRLLADEKAGPKRTTAISAIEDAIKALDAKVAAEAEAAAQGQGGETL